MLTRRTLLTLWTQLNHANLRLNVPPLRDLSVPSSVRAACSPLSNVLRRPQALI
ncbi:MAG: hypothetical protein ACTS6P_00660 [Candidatus Hodgkinia cicadicola]